MPAPAFRKFGKTDQALPVETAETPAETKPVRTNKYGGKCVECGVYVQAKQGTIDKRDDKWVVMHIQPCPTYDQAAIDNVKPGDAVMAQTFIGGKVLFDGDYTVDTPDGHRTFRLRTQSVDEDFMPGKQILSYLSGADNESDYSRFGHLLADGTSRVWKRFQDNTNLLRDLALFLADPHGVDGTVVASVACYACGRKLTVPASVHNGYGPECSKRFG